MVLFPSPDYQKLDLHFLNCLQEGVLDIASDDSDDENDAEIQNYKKQMRQLKRQGFKEKMESDIEEEDEDDGQ